MLGLRWVWRTIRLVLRTLGGLWSVLMMLLMAGSLALSIAMTMVPSIFAAVSGVVESATGLRSLYTQQAEELAQAKRRVTTEAAQRRAAVRRTNDLAGELADSRAAQARLAREMAGSQVTYRGTRMVARDAVKDTAARISHRTALATSRNIASMGGEALPAIGVGVIVAATAWELSDACALMGEMRELDAAFNPEHPITDSEICGMKVPTRAELWAGIMSSPAAAWDGARELYGGLPDASISVTYTATIDYLAGFTNWAFGGEAEAASTP